MNRRIKVKLKEILAERRLSIRKLALLTGVRHSTLCELANQKRLSLHYPHLILIADVLNIDLIDQLITFEMDKPETDS